MDNDLWLFLIFVVVVGLPMTPAAFLLLRNARQRQRQKDYIRQYTFPPGLMDKLGKHRPALSAAQWERVLAQLKTYFIMCHMAERRLVAMPSQVVDEAWHEFILFTRAYHDFCRQGLGRYLHHTPAEAMVSPTHAQTGLRRAWRLACEVEGIDPAAPDRLPPLFALDAELDIADGYHYALDCMKAGTPANRYCANQIGCSAMPGGCGGDMVGDADGCGGDGGCGGD